MIPTSESRLLTGRAFLLTRQFDRTVYDAIYVVLAMELGCEVVTADEKLANALGARFPVRWLGALS